MTAVVDFKFRNVRSKQPWYDDNCWQIAAYHRAHLLEIGIETYATVIAGVNVIVSTNPETAGVYVKEWSHAELEWGEEVFINLLDGWRLRNRFPFVRKEYP